MPPRGARIPILAALVALAVLGWLLVRGCGVEEPPRPPTPPPSGGGTDAEPEPLPTPAEAPAPAEEEAPGPPPAPEAGKGLAVAGTVYHQDGATPLAGVSVVLRQEGERRTWSTAEDGSFRFEGLSPGEVQLEAVPPDETAGTKVWARAVAGDEAVRLVFHPRARVRLDVRDAATGERVTAYLRVVEVLASGEERTRINSTGGLNPDFAPIDLYPKYPVTLRVVADGYADSETMTFRYDLAEPARTVVVKLEPAPELTARLLLTLRYETGRLVQKAGVARHLKNGGHSGSAHPVVQGLMTLELRPGDHDLEVFPLDDDPADDVAWAPHRFQIRLEAGARVEREIVFRPGGFLRLRGPGADPADFVFLEWEGGPPGLATGEEEEEEGVRWRRFGPLARGNWRVRGSTRGQFRPAEFVIRPGKVTEVVLKPAD